MKKNLTEIVFILDRSGSMAGLEDDTIGGFNAMIEKQKREDGEAYVSTVLFDNHTEVIHDRVNIQKIQPMTRKDYYVRGCTALLDAVARPFTTLAMFISMLVKRIAPKRPSSSLPPTAWRMPAGNTPTTG